MHIGLAKAVLPYSDPDLIALGWNDTAVGPRQQDLFSGGYCEECKSPVGTRNDMPVTLARTPKADLCGFEERATISDTARAKRFLARSDIGAGLDSLFLVRDAHGRTQVAMTFPRFEVLARELSGVSLWPGRFFCLDEAEVERRPKLPPYADLAT